MLLTQVVACGGGGSGDSAVKAGGATTTFAAQAQKGPYQPGGRATLYRLDPAGNRTQQSAGFVTGTLGWFIPTVSWTGLTELEVDGNFFDESAGAISTRPLRLTALASLPVAEPLRINLFTHLTAARVRWLMVSGASYSAARATAEADVENIFHLQSADSARLDVTDGSGDRAADNANLLLFSAALLATGAGQHELDTLTADFADDGAMSDAGLPVWIRVSVRAGTLEPDEIKQRLETLEGVEQAPGFAALGHLYPAWVNLAGDADADGITDAQEILLRGTDPLLADTDGDGMADGWEVTHSLNPLADDAAGDADGDGLTEVMEFTLHTDPHNDDSDGDSWLDGFEIAAGGNPNDPSSLPLVFLSSPGSSAETGFTYQYAPLLSWSNAAFSLDQAPPGVAIASDSGAVSWTPSFAQTGDYDVSLRADASGYSAVQSFVISTMPGNTGDLNEDGLLDGKDILLCQRIVLGLLSPDATQQVRGDLSADGAVSEQDLVMLQRLVMDL